MARYSGDELIYRAQVTQFIDRHSLMVRTQTHGHISPFSQMKSSIIFPSICSSAGFVCRLRQHRTSHFGQRLRVGPILRYDCIPGHQLHIGRYKSQRGQRADCEGLFDQQHSQQKDECSGAVSVKSIKLVDSVVFIIFCLFDS